MHTQSNAGQPAKPGQTPKPPQQPKPSAPNTTPAKGAPSVGTPGNPQKPAQK
ncbi:MAG: hypothetical protein IT449_07175 [Phycisphaerales bacterium]|nr:hypothetical protein [Phycisphaerales bacterium]